MKSSIWYEKYKPECVSDMVLPEKLKAKIQSYVDKEDIPNLAFMSADPGCLLPGTSITVDAEPVYITNGKAMIKYSLAYYDMILLRYLTNTAENAFIDDNLVTNKLISILQLCDTLKAECIDTIDDDKRYKNKYLKLMYWVYKYNNFEQAVKKVKTLRRYSHFFEDLDNMSNFKDFNPNTVRTTILKIRFKMMYNEFENMSDLFKLNDDKTNVDYWTFRGWSIDEANSIVSGIINKKIEQGGYYYYIKLHNDNSVYYHVGVTRDYIDNTFTPTTREQFNYDVIVFKWYDSYVDAKIAMQKLISDNSSYRIIPQELNLSDVGFFYKDVLK